MAKKQRKYDTEYKVRAVKLAKELGGAKAAAVFGCFDAAVPGLSMDTNMKASLCKQTLDNAVRSCPALYDRYVTDNLRGENRRPELSNI